MIKFSGKLIQQSQGDRGARLLQSAAGHQLWIPKSVMPYFSNDGQGNCKFSVERWKVKDVQKALFDEE